MAPPTLAPPQVVPREDLRPGGGAAAAAPGGRAVSGAGVRAASWRLRAVRELRPRRHPLPRAAPRGSPHHRRGHLLLQPHGYGGGAPRIREGSRPRLTPAAGRAGQSHMLPNEEKLVATENNPIGTGVAPQEPAGTSKLIPIWRPPHPPFLPLVTSFPVPMETSPTHPVGTKPLPSSSAPAQTIQSRLPPTGRGQDAGVSHTPGRSHSHLGPSLPCSITARTRGPSARNS